MTLTFVAKPFRMTGSKPKNFRGELGCSSWRRYGASSGLSRSMRSIAAVVSAARPSSACHELGSTSEIP